MAEKAVFTVTLVLASTLTGCGALNESSSDPQNQLFLSFYRSCVEANGGARMDAVGFYGGQLGSACAQWAHRRARESVLYPL